MVRSRLMMRRAWATAVLLGTLLVPAAGQSEGEHAPVGGAGEPRLALVIGNGNYINVSPLAHPVADARSMAKALEQCGFRVILETDCVLSGMREAVAEFRDSLQPGGAAVFYYAGHGIQLAGRNYLIPIDIGLVGEAQARDECVRLSEIWEALGQGGDRTNIAILDACRNNPFPSGFEPSGRGLARSQQEELPPELLIAYATTPGRVAADDGRYTAALLRYLVEPGLEVKDLFMHVGRDVSKASSSSQRPWVVGALTREFFFVPGPPPPWDEMVEVSGTGLFIDTCEVTNGAFAEFLSMAGNEIENGVSWLDVKDEDALIHASGDGYRPRAGYADHPVVEVSWHGARAYCAWRGKRLPSADEWLLAFQGPDERIYPWGDEAPDTADAPRANLSQGAEHADGYARTAPVGTYPGGASPCGALDMAGNVWEWIDAARGERRLLLGGSWFNDAQYLRSDSRYWSDPSLTMDHAGFRCVRDR